MLVASAAVFVFLAASAGPGLGSDVTALPPDCSPARGEGLPAGDDARVFALDRVRTYTLCLEPADWEQLQRNALKKEYERAWLFVDGEKIGEVGLRYKGHYTLENCYSEGVQTCPKVSMKVKFNEYKAGLNLNGLENLHFDAMHRDTSLMREHIAYYLFRAMNVPAPRTAYARLVVNNKDLGLFTIVEQVDEKFVKKHFGKSAGGNLYKELWPPISNREQALNQLRTNRRAADLLGFIRFGRELALTSPEIRPQIVRERLQVDEAMRFLAVDRTINNRDGITTFYCEDNYCGNHNYYLYEDSAKRFWVLPWDVDAVFGTSTDIESIPEWNERTIDCNRRYDEETLRAPGCDVLFQGLAQSDIQTYRSALATLASGPLQSPELYQYIDRLAAFIAPHVATDPHGPAARYWENAVAALKDDVAATRLRAQALQGEGAITSAQLEKGRVNNWEQTSNYSVVLGLKSISSPSSSLRHQLNDTNPLQGLHDLRLDFTFRNGDTPWAQWGFISASFPTGGADLRSFSKLSLVLRAGKPREVRISIDSPVYSKSDEGVRYSWQVPVGPEATTIALPFDTLALPEWASPVPETKSAVLAKSTALLIGPLAVGIDSTTGFFPDRVTDQGYLQVDDIAFLP